MSVRIFGKEIVDRVVCESLEGGVRVCGCMVSVGDYGDWGMDGNWDINSELNKMNGIEVLSEVVIEEVYDGVSVGRRDGEWVMVGWLNGEEEVICKLKKMDGWSDIRMERMEFVEKKSCWDYEVKEGDEE